MRAHTYAHAHAYAHTHTNRVRSWVGKEGMALTKGQPLSTNLFTLFGKNTWADPTLCTEFTKH